MSHTTREVSRYRVGGVPIAAIGLSATVTMLVAAAERGESVRTHLCNVYTLSLVERDHELRNALHTSDLNLADGAPVAWLGRHHGMSAPVRGPSLVCAVAQAGTPAGLRHYFYGGAPGVAADMAKRLDARVTDLDVAGVESPPYRISTDSEVAELAERIRTSQAHIVWIGLGTPRQDYLVPRLAALVDAVIVPVGAAFDFMSGRVAEAPELLHGSGLEWLYRLCHEPSRLWRRYLIGGPRFVAAVVRHAAR